MDKEKALREYLAKAPSEIVKEIREFMAKEEELEKQAKCKCEYEPDGMYYNKCKICGRRMRTVMISRKGW